MEHKNEKYLNQMSTSWVIYLIGVSGVGKSTVGKALSEALGIPFIEGDDFHPEEDGLKLSEGQPLNDEDREEWLHKLNLRAKEQLKKGSCVIASSALKECHRKILSKDIQDQTKWIFLHGTYEQISNRWNKGVDRFLKSDLLQSQLDILEEPDEAISIDVSLTPQSIVSRLKSLLTAKSEFGLFGLGFMGKILSKNLASKGFNLSLYNRHRFQEGNVAQHFKNKFPVLASAQAFDDIEAFVNSLQTPRKIMLMVNAGKATDSVIEDLLPFLSEGDILIDGGNSNYNASEARFNYLKSKKIHFIGAGVSGGEEGASKGFSIMSGGDEIVYGAVQGYLEAMSARDEEGLPCCTYIGPQGSGHFVKMVHNGIEYAEMQLLAEVYAILKHMGKTPDEIASVLESWQPSADSYLLAITIDILRKREGPDWLLDKVLDKAGNKGSGNWATIDSAEYGVPSTMISAALNARYLSYFKEDRNVASKNFGSGSDAGIHLSETQLLNAYQFSRIINYYQGFRLIYEVSKAINWDINLSELARIWTQGSIIRSDLMKEIVPIFKETSNILTNDTIIEQLKSIRPGAKTVVTQCILHDIAIPGIAAAINFFNGYTTANSPANLVQAQRNYFGAHTYQRIDGELGEFHHSNWKSES